MLWTNSRIPAVVFVVAVMALFTRFSQSHCADGQTTGKFAEQLRQERVLLYAEFRSGCNSRRRLGEIVLAFALFGKRSKGL